MVLGDWPGPVRDPLGLLRLVPVVAAVAWIVKGDLGGAAVLAVLGAAGLGVRLLDLPRVIDLAFLLVVCIASFGEVLGFYDRYAWFDTAVHVTVPMLGAPVAYVALARAEVVPDPRDRLRDVHAERAVVVLTIALGAATGAVWELTEWLADSAFGSRLQESLVDTNRDLLADTIGATLGAGLLLLWTRRGWGSVRRIPGENRFEDTDA